MGCCSHSWALMPVHIPSLPFWLCCVLGLLTIALSEPMGRGAFCEGYNPRAWLLKGLFSQSVLECVQFPGPVQCVKGWSEFLIKSFCICCEGRQLIAIGSPHYFGKALALRLNLNDALLKIHFLNDLYSLHFLRFVRRWSKMRYFCCQRRSEQQLSLIIRTRTYELRHSGVE